MGRKGAYELSAIEKAISLVSPSAAQKRFQDRIRLNEFSEIASTGMLRGSSGGASSNGAPETFATQRNRLELMWEARALEKSSPLIAGVLKRLSQYVVGSLSYRSATGDPQIDKIYNQIFSDWAKASDYTGRMSLRDQVEMLFRSSIRDGDHGFNIVESEDLRSIKLQCIEADRIGSPHESRLDENYVAGLHLKEGRVVEYDVYKRTVSGQYVKSQTVPASKFIHYYRNRRADEYRGRTPLEPALPSARDLLEIFGFEKAAQKFASMWAAFVTTSDPAGNSGFAWDKTDPVTGWNMTEAMPGKIFKGKPGESMEFAQGVARPNQAFLNLVELTIQMIALSLDLPFGFVFDMSKFGGVTARIETQLAKRTIQGFQRSLIDDVLNKIRDEVIGRAIMFRLAPPHRNWKSGTWHFGAHITSDIQYQTSADLQLINAGLKSPQDWCEENDVDFDRTTEAIADAKVKRIQVSDSRELPVEVAFPEMASATELLAAYKAKDEPPSDGGLIEEVGESGVKPLIQVVEQYHAGAIDRESALMQLTEMYGFDPQKAELFLPEKRAIGRVIEPPALPGG